MTAIEADNRPASYLEDGNIILRASSIGGCTRDLVLHLLGADPLPIPDEVQKRFDAGTAAEPHILQRMRDEGWLFEEGLAQQEGELKVLPAGDGKPAVIIRYHPDGVAAFFDPCPGEPYTSLTELHIVEAKALAESSWEQASRKGTGSLFNYDWQLSVMMHASRLPGVWVALKKNPDDPDDYSGPLHIEFVDKAPIRFGEIVKKAKGIRDAYLSGEAPDCSDYGQYPCAFAHLRPEREDLTEQAEGDLDDEIAHWAQIYDKESGIAKEAEANKRAARDHLMDALGNRGGLRGGGWRVTKHVQIRTKFDRQAAEKELGPLERFDTPSEVPTIKVVRL